MFDINTVEDVALLRETFEVECKLAAGRDGRGKLPDDFWRTYSAFANTRGGTVILGLREVNGEFELSGIADPGRVRTELFSLLNNREKISANLLADRDVRTAAVEGRTLVAIDVPAAGRKAKPVYVGSNPMTGTYRRLNDGDCLCDGETVRRMLAEQLEDSRDIRVLRNFTVDDLSTDTVRSFRQALRDRRPAHPFLDADDRAFLQLIGALRRDRDSGDEGLTVAGLLMFGNYQSIQEEFPHFFLDYQEHAQPQADARWVDRFTLDGTWPGNLFEFYRRVYRKLVADLKVPFALREGRRVEETPVHHALREALVNAIVHADYTARASVLVVKRPDMFGFRNPGTMRLPVAQAIAGGESDGRNRTLQTMFLLIGAGERAGSGVPKIYKGWADQHWRPPALYDTEEPSEQTRLELHMLDLIPPGTLAVLRERFGSGLDTMPPAQRLVLATAVIEGSVNHPRMAAICTMHPADLTRLLQGMVHRGELVQAGRSRGATYRLPERPLPSNDPRVVAPTLAGPPEGGELPTKRGEFGGKGGEFAAEGGEIDGRADDGSPHRAEDAGLPPELVQIATPLRTLGRVSFDDASAVILELCRGRQLTLRQLAVLLKRESGYLQSRILNPMVRAGKLLRTYPQPNDPRQAYTTAPDMP